MKPGRNDPCACGSGKKFKKCCQGKSEFNSPAPNPSGKGATPTPDECNQLVALFNDGQHVELERQACLLVEIYPDFGFVWKVLGATLMAQGKDALPALQEAAKLLPHDAQAHCNLGIALRDLGQFDDAVASCRRALVIMPGYAEAHFNLGIALRDLGQLGGAVTSYRQALEIKPDYAEAHCNLGNALRDLGQFDNAAACYRRALEITAGRVSNVSQFAAYNYGLCLSELALHRESVAYYQKAFYERTGWETPADMTLSSGLAYAFIELTNKCNFHCDFCPSDSQKRTQGFMSLESIYQLYDEVTKNKLVQQIGLHLMGEPTLHPDLLKVLNYAAAKNIKTELVTNGSTLNAKTAPRILDSLYGTLIISLQTPTQESYKHRGDTGLSWHRYIENIRLMVREHLRRVASKQVCRHKLELRVMITRDSKLSANIIESSDDVHAVIREWCTFVTEVEVEMGLATFSRHVLPAELFSATSTQTRIIYPLQQGLILNFWQGFTFANSMLSGDYALEHEESVNFCSRPFLDVAVLSNGDVTLCCLDYDGQLAVGNMKDNTLETILNGKSTLDLRAAMFGRHPLPLFCQQCQAKAVPVAHQDKLHRKVVMLKIDNGQ